MSSADISSLWSIAIKTVGSGIKAKTATITNQHDGNIDIHAASKESSSENENDTSSSPPQLVSSSSSGESHSFTLQVHPNDPLHSLSAKIESITGLSPSEQRLIYRGRIISVPPPPPNNNHDDTHSYSTIRDINGLSDGETIHLVPRVSSTVGDSTASSRRTNSATNPDHEMDGIANALMGGLLAGFNTDDTAASSGLSAGGSTGANVASLSGSDGMNLLAALLGLGSAVDSNNGVGRPRSNNNNNNRNQQQRRQGGGISGSGQGLGGIVSRAAMMGVLDDGGGNNSNLGTTAAVTPTASVGGIGGSARTTMAAQPPRPTPTSDGLFNRSVDEIRSSRNATTATANPFNPNNSSTNNAHGHTVSASPSSSSSATRAARNRRRATAARLTASDIRVPDPGSMEPVRQGLMTLHTLLGNAELSLNEQRRQRQPVRQQRQEVDDEEKGGEEEDMADNSEEPPITQSYHDRHPLNSHRQWYRGQWLDALDTVNQWLEATIVDIVLPSDLLGDYAVSRSRNGTRRRRSMYSNISQQPVEAVVSGNDLEGRRRLLLEPRPASEEDDDNAIMGVYDLLNEGYRPRDDNDGVQLLLIHYNGWPHRWDEWIRSDSPRIRPFRTRTRHRAVSARVCPTPQAVFQAAPSTFIRDESDEVERAVLLPELQRVIASVNDVISSMLPPVEMEGRGVTSSSLLMENDSPSTVDSSHLPWHLPNHGSEYFQSAAADIDDGGNSGYSNDSVSASSSSLRPGLDPLGQLNAAQLRQLAPLLDRLGRTLTDSAPHIASLADALPSPSPLPQARPIPPRQQQVGYGSESFAAQASRLYFGINSDNEGRSESASSNPIADAQVMEVEPAVDPDLTDFVNGMVNTTRGGSSRNTNREPISSSLLASYLSSIGAGAAGDNNDTTRILRLGGGDGVFNAGSNGGGGAPGIDIHIHAIVTGPGMTPTGLDGLGIGGGGPSVNRNVNVDAPITAIPEQQQTNGSGVDGDEIDHLFSDLYSESPPPINLHHNQRHYDNGNNENLGQIFEECRSIDEESDSSIDSVATEPFDGKVVASTDEDVGPSLEEGATSANSELASESDNTKNDSSTIQTASVRDARRRAPPADRASFGRRMYRRTFGRLTGSSRRFSGS